MDHILVKWFLIFIGLLAVLVGMITFWLPIPIGLPLMLLGLTILMRYSPYAKLKIIKLAKNSPAMYRVIRRYQVGKKIKRS